MGNDSEVYVWNGIDLEELRQIMDPPADEAVATIFKSRSMRHLASQLKDMARNDDFKTDSLPEDLQGFFNDKKYRTFTDEDIEMFNRPHRIWKEHGSKFIVILFFRALPYTYMAEKPANVLRMTKLLEEHTARRVIETAQFVFDVMDKEWWAPDKRGIMTTLKKKGTGPNLVSFTLLNAITCI